MNIGPQSPTWPDILEGLRRKTSIAFPRETLKFRAWGLGFRAFGIKRLRAFVFKDCRVNVLRGGS